MVEAGEQDPDFASIVSSGSSGSGGGKGGVPRPAAVRASSLLSGERKTGFAALEHQVCLSTNNDEVIIGTHATTIRYIPRCQRSLGLPPHGFCLCCSEVCRRGPILLPGRSSRADWRGRSRIRSARTRRSHRTRRGSKVFPARGTGRRGSVAARPVFLSPDSSVEARTAASLGTSPFPPSLLPLLTIEAKSGVLLPGLDHVLLRVGNKEAFPAALVTTFTSSSAVGNASLLPAPRRTWSRPGSKTPDFASIVSNESSGSGGRKGGVPRPAAVRASSLLSGERKSGFAALERQMCLSTNNDEAILGTHVTTMRYTPLSAQLRSYTTWLFFFFLLKCRL